MSNVGGVGSAVDNFCMNVINTGVQVKRGVLDLGEKGSRILSYGYNMEAFEKLSKAIIAWLRNPLIFGLFKNCVKTIEAQRDLVYATLVFGSTVDFIKTSKTVDPKTGEKKTVYSFHDPRKMDGVKLCYGIGNFFEVAKFLQVYNVFAFSSCARLSGMVGSYKLFNLGGNTWRVGDIPLVNAWFNHKRSAKPKDSFVFVAALITLVNSIKTMTTTKKLTLEPMLKIVTSTGKMILVSSADYMLDKKLFWTLSIVDLVTNNLSFVLYVMKRSKEREARFKDPTKAV